ncbi:MAG: AAA family ATPase, partial [Myxococcota bacterium]
MRILRLRLKNYRGIADREVRFAEQGVTVVSGPNEVGKSSLAEAIDLVFDELDSTTKQRVRDVQPVHRDAGAEIEVDVETGPYAFTYAKRFQRRARTQLTVTRPKLEHRSGREAHQRVRAILDETLDLDLWRALRIQQGQGLVQASWGGAPALAAALDRAAGAAPTDREEGLLEAAAAEAARYFTKTGRPRRQLAAAEREAGAARQRAEQAGQDLAKLEGDVARAEELRSVRAACELAVRQAEQELREQEQRFEPVVALRDALATAVAQRDLALAEEREARQRARERGRLVAAHAAAEADLAHRAEEIESGEPALRGPRAPREHP